MSATTKKFLIRDYKDRIGDTPDALVVSIRGVTANDNNRLRLDLAKKQIKVTVVRNNLARHALKDGSLAGLAPLFSGPTAIAYGGNSVVDVAREIMTRAEKIQALELRGAILDGVLSEGKKGVERLSKFPTRSEALSQTVTLILSPARKLMGQIKGPGAKVMGLIKTIETKLEKGEEIAKIA